MSSEKKWGNFLMIGLVIIGILFASGCLNSNGERYYFPVVDANFDSTLNIFSLYDVMIENNITCSIIESRGSTAYQPILYMDWPDNTTYIFSNNSYNISATTAHIVDGSDAPTPSIWMTLYLEDIPQYRYSSEEEAQNATYLLEPTFELIKYFLNESSNPMPYNVEYTVSWILID